LSSSSGFYHRYFLLLECPLWFSFSGCCGPLGFSLVAFSLIFFAASIFGSVAVLASRGTGAQQFSVSRNKAVLQISFLHRNFSSHS
jgi:hypothetical protein